MQEQVFAIPTVDLWELIPYKKQGFISGSSLLLIRIVQKGLFEKRSELETDPLFKQIIPYAVISCCDSFYLFKRRPGQKEKRLHNKYSLGIGGHMNPVYPQKLDENYIIEELKREFFEEIELYDGCKIEQIKFIGFINDDTISVGNVHIGLLYHIQVSSKNLKVNEPQKMSADWVESSYLVKHNSILETWSKIAYDCYIKRI